MREKVTLLESQLDKQEKREQEVVRKLAQEIKNRTEDAKHLKELLLNEQACYKQLETTYETKIQSLAQNFQLEIDNLNTRHAQNEDRRRECSTQYE